MRYYSLRYVDSLPRGAGGNAKGPLISILHKYKGDQGLLEHEKCHVRQWFMLLGIGHALLYRFSKRYKLWAEIQAYKIQLKYNPANLPIFALYLATHYGLDLIPDEAKRLLSE
jgi:hypothetical protein